MKLQPREALEALRIKEVGGWVLQRSKGLFAPPAKDLSGLGPELEAVPSAVVQQLGALASISAESSVAPAADGALVRFVPVELLFTEGLDQGIPADASPEWHSFHAQWADLPLARLRPHLALFDYFLQRGSSPDEYLDWWDGLFLSRGLAPPVSREALLEQRYREFCAMEKLVQSPGALAAALSPAAELNDRGYFNLRDGHHRAAFLFVRGWRRIPVRMSSIDAARFGHSQWVGPVLAEIVKQERRLFYTPILAPAFFDQPSERDGAYPSRLDHILRELGSERVSGRRVLDIGSNLGFYAQHFAREGANVTAVEPDAKHAALACRLGDLLQAHYQLFSEPFETAAVERCDVGIMLSVLYHFVDDERRCAAFLEKIDRCVGEKLFWESGADPEREKALILERTHLRRYRKLAETYGTGKRRELGVFCAG
jgi:SAM-dependent methyltransferase